MAGHTPGGGPHSNDVDLGQIFQKASKVSIDEGERLHFARQVLLWLAVICVGVFIAHGCYPQNAAVTEIFELVKIGAPPLVTLVISFYFPNSSTR